MDGWLPRSDVSLLYGAYASGKTTLALAMALAFAKGEPFLDRSTPGEKLKSLFIATDSGVVLLKEALEDRVIC